MPSYVRAGIRKCARIRALSTDTKRNVFVLILFVINYESQYRIGCR